MILGFDFLGFQAIKCFPTKNRIFLHVMQSTTTNNSFLLVFYSYVLVFYPYVTGMYLVCTRMLLVCTRMYSYVTRMYLYVACMYSCGVLVMILVNYNIQHCELQLYTVFYGGLHYRSYLNITALCPYKLQKLL